MIAPDSNSSNSVLLVTVTQVEAQAVLQAFTDATGHLWQRHFIDDQTYYALGRLGEVDVFMVQSEMGAVGPGAALLTIRNALDALHPTSVIMVGIAFGINSSKRKLGDILVSRQLQAYEPQKIRGDRIIPRGDRVTASTRLLSLFRSGVLDWPGAAVHFGLVLSGEKLIDDEGFLARLLEHEPEALGGEMEGAGLYAAATNARVDWILVKAICDWADGRKTDDAQPLAARNAAEFVRHVVQQGGLSHRAAAPDLAPRADGDPTRDRLLERLVAQRARLADLLTQLAKHGSAWAPPALLDGIREGRQEIKKIKQTLRDWGVTAADHPDDEA